MKSAKLQLLKNTDFIALNQDTLCLQAYEAALSYRSQILVKDIVQLGSLSRAYSVYSPTGQECHPVVIFSELDIAKKIRLREAFTFTELNAEGTLSLWMAPNTTSIFIAEVDSRLERTHYEAEMAYISYCQELMNHKAVNTGSHRKADRCSAGFKATRLGGNLKNDLQRLDVTAWKGGRYAFTFACFKDEQRYIDISANGRRVQTVNVSKSNNGKAIHVTVEVKLKKGHSIVKLSNATNRLPDIDYMLVGDAKYS